MTELNTNNQNIVKEEQKDSLEGKKILWVEDDKFLVSILTKKLESHRAILSQAKTFDEAFSILDKDIPDLVILDVMLQGLDGYDILQKMKMSDRTKNIPVMMLSNLGQTGDIEKAKMLGADSYLVKASVTPEAIVKAIRSLLKLS